MNQFLLQMLSEAAAPNLIGRRIGAIRTVPPVVTVELTGDGNSRYAVTVLSTPGPFFYIDSVDPIGGLGSEAFRRIRGFPLTRVWVPPGDRVIQFELSGHRESLVLAVYLFGSRAKVRLEGPDTIIESLDAEENGAPLPAGRPARRAGLATIDAEALADVLLSAEAIERQVPGLTQELIDCFKDSAGGVDARGLLVFRDAALSGGEPYALGTRKRLGSVCVLPADFARAPRSLSLTHALGPFNDADEACRRTGVTIIESLQQELLRKHSAALAKYLSGRKRLLSVLETESAAARQFASLRQEANILAAYQSRIPSGASSVNLPDLYGGGETSIALDPALPIAEQIKKRFRRAAKMERSRTALEKRIQTVGEEIGQLEKDLAAAGAAHSFVEALRVIERSRRHFGFVAGPRREARVRFQEKQLRRIDLGSEWFVVVGRSDRENDEITFRLASPDDFWLHAQHVPGSHVVLKSRGNPGNPPDAILDAAAGIAAHFSKAHRASVVPVIYTRRKYVRKFKGSRPGQVVCEREKTIFAKPRLPDSDTDH